MILAQAIGAVDIAIILLYLFGVAYLGWLGYKRTQTTADYMLAGRKAHPVVMALSYGATFISTSAIVGFGGVAGMFGMSLLWLTFANIFIGIFIAFVVLGPRVRAMGHQLDAHTFPELLGRRYRSRFIQVASGTLIFLFMPLYAAAVMIGGAEFLSKQFHVDYNAAMLVFVVIVAAYVLAGGLKAVMYTDALQGAIMVVGMTVLLIWAYVSLGGVQTAHQGLSDLAGQAFVGFKAMGHQGWTSMPQFGWGQPEHELWWVVVSTITLGVGIGVLAQPQLSVRFMTVKSKRELNRAVAVGGLFILMIPGVAYTVGALSNVYFAKHEVVTGVLTAETDEQVIAKKGKPPIPVRLLHIDTTGAGESANTFIVLNGLGKAEKIMPQAQVVRRWEQDGRKMIEVRPNAPAFQRAVVRTGGKFMFNADSIIPIYISSAMPKWFGLLFLLTLLAAAMSTLSSQFHASGTSLGHDIIGALTGRRSSIGMTRVAILVGLVIAVLFGLYARGGYIIARATSIFFGLCASAFLPPLVGGLFFKRMTRPAAIASMMAGAAITTFWLVLVKAAEAGDIGLVFAFTGDKPSLLGGTWAVVDPIVVALPISSLVAVVVSAFTRPAASPSSPPSDADAEPQAAAAK